MAAFTSKASGNWTATGQSTWNEAGTPGNGDSITINAGHTVTIPDGAGTVTVGRSLLGSPPAPSYSGTTASTTIPWSSGGANIAISVVDSGGKESILSPNQQQTFVSGVTKPRLTMPALPAGASSFSVYLDNGSNGGVRRYASGVGTGATVDLTSANWLAGTNDYSTAPTPPQDAAAIKIASTGKLVVGASSPTTPPTLVVRGDIASTQSGGRTGGFYPLTLNPGVTLEFDASQASNPTVQGYVFSGSAYNQPNNYLNFNGTSINRVTVRSNASGGNGRFSLNGQTGNLQMDAAYTDFLRLGSSSTAALDLSLNVASYSSSITNCTFTSCGPVSFYGGGILSTTSTLIFNDNRFTSSLETRSFRIRANNNLSSGTREIKRNYFDLFVNDPTFGGNVGGFTVQHNVFAGDFYMDPTQMYALFDLNVVRKTAATWASSGYPGDISNSYFLADGNVYNPHFLSATASRASTFDGLIFQCTGSAAASDGDGIGFSGSAASVLRSTVKNCIVLPRSGDGLQSSCTLATCANTLSRQQFADVQHNTVWGSPGTEHGMQLNETTAAVAGMVPLYRSNIYYDTSARGNHFNIPTSGKNPPDDDILTASGATNNCAWNATTYSNVGKGSDGTFYSVPTTSGQVPGTGDVNVDPTFIDTTRNFEKFATTFGDAASVANTLARLQADPATQIPALLAYVRGGFAPTNALLATAGHDGATIGAVAYVVTSTAVYLSGGGEGPFFNFLEA